MEVLEGEKLFSNEGGEDKGEAWTDPSHFHSKLEGNLKLLLRRRRNQKTLTINAEDLNAKHTEWNCKATNTRSRILTRFVKKKTLLIFTPNEDTHIHKAIYTIDILELAQSRTSN